jgi:uncharacterized membrane protein YphA (DoxX/SURF4 family)
MENVGGWPVTAARLLLGLVFFVFGLNGFLNFIPAPEMTGKGPDFIAAMADTGYMLYLVAGTEALCGAAFLSGLFVPLALVLLTPVLVNIVAYHIFLDPSGAAFGIVGVVVVLHAFLTYKHWDLYRPLVRMWPAAKATGAE